MTCVCVSPVLCSVAAEMGMLALLSSSLMPVLSVSTQITSCLTDFTSCCDVADADSCFATSPGQRDGNDREREMGKTEERERFGSNEGQEGREKGEEKGYIRQEL